VSYRTAAIILSDRAAAGTRADACIPVIRELLGDAFLLEDAQVLPDEPAALAAALISLADVQEYALILTSGGTGLGPRDRTPQTTASVLDYEIPGIGEAMRAASAGFIKTAMLSRSIAGVRGRSLIINLPGSPKAVRETLGIVLPALPHALDLLAGAVIDG